MAVRPTIGVCAALERARWSHWDQQAHLTPRGYVDAVQRAGGLAILLPVDAAAEEDPDSWLDLVDGLILAGGADVDPGAYGQEPHPTVTHTVPERDAFEMALARRAVERDLPLLGICRGMQVINVALGGTLIQHVPDAHGHHDHLRRRGTFDGADHDVRLQPGSLAASAAGEELHATKSHHHQAVDAVGDGLKITGWAMLDDLPEAIELPEAHFVLGVQWHPEVDEESRVVAAFVDAAGAGGSRRAGAAEVAA